MFHCRLAQGHILRKLLDAIKELITDANFEVTETGLSLQAMDPSHVALVSVLLHAGSFEPYTCTRSHCIGVNFGNLSKIVRCAGADDVITLRGEDDDAELTLQFESPTRDRLSEYQLRLMNIDQEGLAVNNDDADAEIEMNSAEFTRICRDMQVITETITIEVTKGEVSFSGQGELGKGYVTLKQPDAMAVDENEPTLSIRLSKPVSGKFGLKYMNMFTKASTLSETVKVCLSHEQPLRIEYEMEEVGFIRYYLAPKDDGDNEE
eukprot:TRINITY_DN64130_c0_g1_i1.p1 TRINITY_DN64130_c0_g1~~TRINITY_DN64130_c0_g1_i1.p1  ORF type:complete len:264 (-),score=11.03 TRINITY_DN64130_c0_g1_i1:119-910(-)